MTIWICETRKEKAIPVHLPAILSFACRAFWHRRFSFSFVLQSQCCNFQSFSGCIGCLGIGMAWHGIFNITRWKAGVIIRDASGMDALSSYNIDTLVLR